jgi:hypothetical protein
MNARLDNPLTEAGPLLRGMLITALAVAAIGTLLLVRAAVGGGIDHVTVRVDNQAALGLQVDVIDAAGATVGLGIAAPKTLTTFQELPDIGPGWTFVVTYGARQVHRVAMTKAEPPEAGRSRSPPRPPPSSRGPASGEPPKHPCPYVPAGLPIADGWRTTWRSVRRRCLGWGCATTLRPGAAASLA